MDGERKERTVPKIPRSGPRKRPPASAALLAVALTLSPSWALAAAAPSKAKVHGIAVSGRISKVDASAKTFSVLDAAGHEVPLAWTAATRVTGGELKPGEIVTVRYLDKDKKHIATTIHVGPIPAAKPSVPAAPKAATPAPAPVPSPSPAPASR